jgi:hypothetical protein
MDEHSNLRDEALFASIGRLVVTWGLLELGIDTMVDFIHVNLQHLVNEPERPRMLKVKVKYLRNHFRSLPMSDEAKGYYQTLLDRVLKASEFRHDIIHGAVVNHAAGTGEASLIRLIHSSGDFEQKPVTVTVDAILRQNDEAAELASQLLGWSRSAHGYAQKQQQQF